MDFQDQRVVVTGGTRGLGRAATLAFLEAGAIVHATYRGNDAAAEALKADAGDAAGRLVVHRCDVADAEQVAALWEALGEDPVEVLVNNAGIRRDAILPLMEQDAWDAVIATNLTGGYLMTRHAVKNMMGQRYGRVIFVTSPAGHVGFQGQTNYGASKAGQVGMARSLCKEVAARGITVNCVSPGFIDTELIGDLPDDLRKESRTRGPRRRCGTPAAGAPAILFLASRAAAYVNGATLEVTGGL